MLHFWGGFATAIVFSHKKLRILRKDRGEGLSPQTRGRALPSNQKVQDGFPNFHLFQEASAKNLSTPKSRSAAVANMLCDSCLFMSTNKSDCLVYVFFLFRHFLPLPMASPMGPRSIK